MPNLLITVHTQPNTGNNVAETENASFSHRTYKVESYCTLRALAKKNNPDHQS